VKERHRDKYQIFTLLIAGVLPFSFQNRQADGMKIMPKFKQQERTKDTSVAMKLTLVNPSGGKREREMIYGTRTGANDNRKLLIRFLSPAVTASARSA